LAAHSRQFRFGRQAENALDALADRAKKDAGQPRPSPEQVKLELEREKLQANLKKTALEYSLKKREADQKAELEKQKADYELRLKGLELQLAEAQGQQKLRLQAQEAAQEAAIKQRAMQDKAAADVAAHRQQAVVSAAKLAESNCNAGCAKPTSRRQRRNGVSPKVMRLATCPTF
jgi:hypothetical protein